MISLFTGVNRNYIKETEHSFGEHNPDVFHASVSAKGVFYTILILIRYLNCVSGFCLKMFGFSFVLLLQTLPGPSLTPRFPLDTAPAVSQASTAGASVPAAQHSHSACLSLPRLSLLSTLCQFSLKALCKMFSCCSFPSQLLAGQILVVRRWVAGCLDKDDMTLQVPGWELSE